MAGEKGKVVLIGKRGSGRTTLANMLVSGMLQDCPQPPDTDSICKTYVGRGWTVIDTMGFGTEPLGGIVPDECARKMTIDFLEEVKGRYSHIIFVVDGSDIGDTEFGRDEESTVPIMWKTFLEIFEGSEENFIVLVTKVQPSMSVPTREEIEAMRTKEGFEDVWFTEVLLMFPECRQFLFLPLLKIPEISTASEATAEVLFSKKQEELERLEKEMAEMFIAKPWVEPDIWKMGDEEINEKAVRITRQLTSSRAGKLRNWDSLHGSVYVPVMFYRRQSVPVSGKELLKGKAGAVSVVLDEMKNLGKEVKFYYRQCEYLLQRSIAASKEIHDLFDAVNWSERILTHSLDRLIKPLDNLICTMKAGKGLLHVCGDSEQEQEVALTLSPPGSGTSSLSKFALVLRDLEWCLDACRFLFHNPEVDRGSRSERKSRLSNFFAFRFHIPKVERASESERQACLSKFMWCEARCRMVYMDDGENMDAGVHLAESCVAADNDRQAQDQQDLISSMESHFSTLHNPRKVQNKRFDSNRFFSDRQKNKKQPSSSEILNYMSILKNRLQGDSSFEAPNTIPGCFSIRGNQEFRSIQLIGKGSYKEVHECEWLGMNVAVATSQNQDRLFRPVLEAEAGALARVQHPNVVSFIGFTYDEEKSQGYLVTELLETSLRALIDRSNRHRYSSSYPFTISESIDILLQIVEAMIHVHECGVMHRDLKADNLLANRAFDSNGGGLYVAVVKLVDFGTSKPQSAETGSNFKTKNVGTRAWMAPEVIRKDGNDMQLYTMSADVYSFGMTCYEILTGEVPFRLYMGRALPEAICAGQRPRIPDNCPDGLRELMTKCWTHIPRDRPTFKEIRRKLWSLKLYYTICEV